MTERSTARDVRQVPAALGRRARRRSKSHPFVDAAAPLRGDRTMIDAGVGDKIDAKGGDHAIDRTPTLSQSLPARAERNDVDVVPIAPAFDHAGASRRDGSGRCAGASRALRRAHGGIRDATHPNERNRASYLAGNRAAWQASSI
jgi:hypothetical protein